MFPGVRFAMLFYPLKIWWRKPVYWLEKVGQFQRYGCDILTRNDKQNPSEKVLFLHDKKCNAYHHSTHLDEGEGEKFWKIVQITCIMDVMQKDGYFVYYILSKNPVNKV